MSVVSAPLDAGYRCEKCSQAVPPAARACPVCETDAGFPNVRSAASADERLALAARYNEAVASAEARGVTSELSAFEAAVAGSKAVMNRNISVLAEWLNSANPLFLNYYKQVEVLGRAPNGSDWDEQRGTAESAINPHCYRELHFAALTLNDVGMSYYGAYAVILKSVTIEDRASIFERNPFIFNAMHHVVAGRKPPLGYRCRWAERGILAAAKLHTGIRRGDADARFQAVLMGPDMASPDCDYVEVHIYGSINRAGIETIIGPKPKTPPDVLLWRQAKRKAKEFNIRLEEID